MRMEGVRRNRESTKKVHMMYTEAREKLIHAHCNVGNTKRKYSSGNKTKSNEIPKEAESSPRMDAVALILENKGKRRQGKFVETSQGEAKKRKNGKIG